MGARRLIGGWRCADGDDSLRAQVPVYMTFSYLLSCIPPHSPCFFFVACDQIMPRTSFEEKITIKQFCMERPPCLLAAAYGKSMHFLGTDHKTSANDDLSMTLRLIKILKCLVALQDYVEPVYIRMKFLVHAQALANPGSGHSFSIVGGQCPRC